MLPFSRVFSQPSLFPCFPLFLCFYVPLVLPIISTLEIIQVRISAWESISLSVSELCKNGEGADDIEMHPRV